MAVTVPTILSGSATTIGTASYATGTAFSAVLVQGDIVFYRAIDRATGAWEAGRGTWSTDGTLSRDLIIGTSTGSTSAMSWAAGTRDITVTVNPRGSAVPLGSNAAGTATVITPPGPFSDDAAAAAGSVPPAYAYRHTSGTVVWRKV